MLTGMPTLLKHRKAQSLKLFTLTESTVDNHLLHPPNWPIIIMAIRPANFQFWQKATLEKGHTPGRRPTESLSYVNAASNYQAAEGTYQKSPI